MTKPILGGAALGFKNLGAKPRRVTKKPRTLISKARQPPAKDSNVWATLIKKQRGIMFAQNVLTRILELFQNHGSLATEDGHEYEALSAKALILLFQAKN